MSFISKLSKIKQNLLIFIFFKYIMKNENDKICNLINNFKGKKKLKPLGVKPTLLVLINFIIII